MEERLSIITFLMFGLKGELNVKLYLILTCLFVNKNNDFGF